MAEMRWRAASLGLMGLATFLAVAASLLFGPAGLSPREVWAALDGSGPLGNLAVVRSIRLPRALAAALVGGSLAISGAGFQALLRNPLAEPYVLGISGGAALGAVLAIVIGFAGSSAWTLPGSAFAGALAAVFLVLRVTWAAGRGLDPRVLILAGVVIGAFLNAGIMLTLAFAPAESIRSAVFWTMGSLGSVGWSGVAVLAAYTLPCALVLYSQARSYNLLNLGEESAAYLGARVDRVRWITFGAASLLAATCVAVAGVIGFVGLIVPHAARLVWGNDHRMLLPAAFLVGATFLVAADAAARLVVDPAELPVGVVTAFLGVPAFLWLLRREILGT